jgi:DEAD/DEAH box helicase domain-containing protein
MMSGEQNTASKPTSKRKSTVLSPSNKRRSTKETLSAEGSASTEATVEIDSSAWSTQFRQLEQVFRSLNTVYTFCCTRKHFPTTFENLKASVENLTRR